MWYVYVIETLKGHYYTGVARDVNKRFLQHEGKIKGGAKFFHSDKPSLLLFCKSCKDRSSAQKLESKIKSLNRKQKEVLLMSL